MSSLGQICPLTQTESMIYGYGTLKFICSKGETLHQALDLNLIGVMSLHLNILNHEVSCKVYSFQYSHFFETKPDSNMFNHHIELLISFLSEALKLPEHQVYGQQQSR